MAKNKKEKNLLITKIDIRQINRTSQDIESWRTAIRSAESIINPNRRLLYDLYSDMLLDGHLSSVIDKRKISVINSNLVFVDKNGKEVDEINTLIDTEDFEFMESEILNSRFWGYTLLEIDIINKSFSVDLIDRRHVKPQKSIVVKNPSDTVGINYTLPPYDKYVISAGRPDDLGLLMKVAQYVIYKRGNYGDWAQFAELFGMPFRKGKYDGFDEAQRQQLEQALDAAGSAAYAIIPEGTELEFISNNSTGDGELYDKLRKACNEEMDVCIAGQTLTSTAGDKGARALGEVHKDILDEIHLADKRFVRRILNTKLIPILQANGFKAEGGKFIFPTKEIIDKTKKINIDMRIANRQPVSDDYFYETYNVPKPEGYEKMKKEQTAAKQMQQQVFQNQKKDDKNIIDKVKSFFVKAPDNRGIKSEINALYNTGNIVDVDVDFTEDKALTEEADRIAKKIYEGESIVLSESMTEMVAKRLRKGMIKGFGKDFKTLEYGKADFNMLQNLEKNIYHFSAAKNYQQLKDMTLALKDEKGKVRSFTDFKAKASQINTEYNQTWLRTEYNSAINSAEGAANWAQYQGSADEMPLLQYQTAGDDRVRESHALLDNVVRNINDSFWDNYYPPNDWGCRCTTIQLTSDKIKETKKITYPEVPKMFQTNLAKKGLAFPKDHPYYKMPKTDKKKVEKLAKKLTPIHKK